MSRTCHNRELKITWNNIQTREGRELRAKEYAGIAFCSLCECEHIFYQRKALNKIGDILDTVVFEEHFSGKRAKKFKLKIITLEKLYKESHPDYRMFLNYNEHNKTKKCYSNLSTLKLGLYDNNIYQ